MTSAQTFQLAHFQLPPPPPPSWKVFAHAHTHEFLKLRAQEQFGETVSKDLTGVDICVLNIACLDMFAYVVMLNVMCFVHA